MVDAITKANGFYLIIKKLFPEAIKDEPDMGSANKLESWLERTEARKYLKECISQGSRCPPKFASNICEELISLERSTFAEKAVKLNLGKMSTIDTITAKIRQKFNLDDQQKAGTTKVAASKRMYAGAVQRQNWMAHRRLEKIAGLSGLFSQVQVVGDQQSASQNNGNLMDFDIGFP